MMSMIGVIMLMGLVTKNAILLVDNANERRAAGRLGRAVAHRGSRTRAVHREREAAVASRSEAAPSSRP